MALPPQHSKGEKHDSISFGLRYNGKASAAGAQTERRGVAGPVRDLLGGETSPAALLNHPHSQTV
jgi:hypothetical protein